MKRLFPIVFLLLASSVHGATFYLSVAGNDSNNGTSPATPWLSPNHAVNCGDVIMAATSNSYSYVNFGPSKWGTVTCSAGNNVAWLECATFDACKINTSSSTYEPGIQVTSSYWGVQGWEVTTTYNPGGSVNACFIASPNNGAGIIHHIIFANDVANGCAADGIEAANNGTTNSVDYFVVLGNIVYSSGGGNTAACASGISVYQPIKSDSLPGTHIYIAGNFSWANLDPATCNGGAPTDGEGIIIDTPDGSQGGLAAPYSQQIVVDNNIVIYNGGKGLQLYNNSTGTAPFAKIYVRNNTSYGNNTFTNNAGAGCSELFIFHAFNTEAFSNLLVPAVATACSSNPLYGASVLFSNATDFVYSNFIYSAAGNNTVTASSGSFAFGPNNLTGTSPSFSNAAQPGAPSCGSFADVPHCAAAIVAGFKPATATAKPYGFQVPGTVSIYDPLYPAWLCSVTNLPTGLVTPGCLTGTSSGGVTVSVGTSFK